MIYHVSHVSCFFLFFFRRPWFTRVSLPFSNYPPANKWIRYGKRSISRSLSQNQMENVWKSPHLRLVTGLFKATKIGGRPSSNSCRRRWWGNPPNFRPPAGFFAKERGLKKCEKMWVFVGLNFSKTMWVWTSKIGVWSMNKWLGFIRLPLWSAQKMVGILFWSSGCFPTIPFPLDHHETPW